MDMEPLLQSQYLESSLLILATHQPPEIAATASFPTVRILRLNAPLAIEDSGAVRFVNVLECAERIARVWRKAGGTGVQEINESDLGGLAGQALAPPTFSFAPSGSVPASPRSSTDQLSLNSTSSTRRRLRSVSSMTLPKTRKSKLPPVDSSQRPFDCLLNYLPANSTDKAILKQSILVTTISRPFLTAASGPTTRRPGTSQSSSRLSVAAGGEDGRRWSTILNRSSVYSAPTTPHANRSRTSFYNGYPSPGSAASIPPPLPIFPRRAHLVHLITPTAPSISRAKLMQSMESFLCSFAYPTPLEVGQQDAAGMERAAPFLMHPYTLRAVVRSPQEQQAEWTIAELLLSGALDRTDKSMGAPPPRAWLSNANDVVFVPGSRPGSVQSIVMPQPPAQSTLPIPARTHYASYTAGPSELGVQRSGMPANYSTWSGSETRLAPPNQRPSAPINLNSVPAQKEDDSFQLPHFKPRSASAAPGSLPTPPDSESDSSGSVTGVTPPPLPPHFHPTSSANSDAHSFPSARRRGFFSRSKNGGVRIRWKFWKATPASVA